MRTLILGGNGMLGHVLCRTLAGQVDLWATYRSDPVQLDLVPTGNQVNNINVEDLLSVSEVLDTVKPNVVVNAVGIVKLRDEANQAVKSIQVNALFPHQLAELCIERGIRLLQISTDCVFSGMRGNYTEVDTPDAVDLYGRTKLLGEINLPGCLTLRTSFIGWQLNSHSGLLSWFALQRDKRIKGYRKAIFSGFSTRVMAQLICDILETRPDLSGLYQVASQPISKYDLLVKLQDLLGWRDIKIEPDDQFLCDRSMSASRFTTATGWHSPSWDSMLHGLAEEWPQYSSYYQDK